VILKSRLIEGKVELGFVDGPRLLAVYIGTQIPTCWPFSTTPGAGMKRTRKSVSSPTSNHLRGPSNAEAHRACWPGDLAHENVSLWRFLTQKWRYKNEAPYEQFSCQFLCATARLPDNSAQRRHRSDQSLCVSVLRVTPGPHRPVRSRPPRPSSSPPRDSRTPEQWRLGVGRPRKAPHSVYRSCNSSSCGMVGSPARATSPPSTRLCIAWMSGARLRSLIIAGE
jgi:hypothetical protein